MDLGNFISQRRKNMGLTQEQLAEKVNVSKSAIAKWETNGGIPDRDNLYKLSEVMDVTVDELHRIIRNNGGSGEQDVNITADVIALLESYGYRVTKKEKKL